MINLDLNEIKERLISECPILGGRVFITIPIDDLSIDHHESPVAFLYPNTDSSGDNTLQRSVRQRMESSVNVQTVVRRTANANDRFGEADTETLLAARREVYFALLGWSPSNSETPLQHGTGGVKPTKKEQAAWVDSFNCNNHNTGN